MLAMMISADRATARKAGYRACLPPLHHAGIWGQAVPKICSVDGCEKPCGKPHSSSAKFCEMHRARMRRFGTTDEPPGAHAPAEVRFWKYVVKAGPDDCWVWTGAKAPGGYGVIGVAARKIRAYRAHRLSWEMANGQPAPDGMVVMHKCDNPPCVNPAHLKLGTYADNTADMMAKGRKVDAGAPGVSNCNAVLTADLVRYIRASDKTNVELAREIGVTRATVRKARLGISWPHIK